MPKLDFFSGQPEDEAKASKEASGASGTGESWDDAFAGMQKLDLFDDDPQEISAPEAEAPDVTQVFSVPETPAVAAQEQGPVDQKEAVGKSVFESLFADDDFEEEEPAKPVKSGLFGSRAKAKKEAAEEAPMFASLFDDDPEAEAPAAPSAGPAVAPVTLAAEPPVQAGPAPVEEEPAFAEPVAIDVTPPAPQPAAVPVFSEEKVPESEPAPSRSGAGRARPIDWHADMLSRIQPRQVVQPVASGAVPVPPAPQPAAPLEEPAWKPILESAMMERSEEPTDYTADEAATRTFVPGAVPPAEPAPAPVQPAPAPVAPRHVAEPPQDFGSLFDDDPQEPQHSPKDIASNIAASFDGGEEDLFGGFDDFGAAPAQPAPMQPQDATSDDIFGGGLYDADPDDGGFDDGSGDEPPVRAPRARRVQDYPSGGNKKIGMFVAIGVVILALLVAVYFLFFNKKDQKDPANSPATPSVSASVSASVPSESLPEPEPVLEAIPRNEWYLQLVNRSNVLDAAYAPELGSVDGQQLDARIVEPMNQMIAAAKNEGITLKLMAGYRTYERQKASYEKGTTDCPPGASEHNLGLSADIMSTEDTSYDAATFEGTKAFAWLQEHAVEYGFILRYPSDKKDVTGFDYEPWHYRYVGSDQAAKIKASGLTLEEYLAQPNPTA